LNLNEKVIGISSFLLNPEEFHWLTMKLAINSGLDLLLTKNGSDKFNDAHWRDFEPVNRGINK